MKDIGYKKTPKRITEFFLKSSAINKHYKKRIMESK